MKPARRDLCRNSLGSAVAVVFLTLCSPATARAYVDPGSGAILWQVFLSGVFGAMFFARQIADWVRHTIRRTPPPAGRARGDLAPPPPFEP